jgi:hypothetical protein
MLARALLAGSLVAVVGCGRPPVAHPSPVPEAESAEEDEEAEDPRSYDGGDGGYAYTPAATSVSLRKVTPPAIWSRRTSA